MTTYIVRNKENSSASAVNEAVKEMLSKKLVDAVQVAKATPYSRLPMPTLFTDVEQIDGMDPLAPVSPYNAARQAASVAKYATGKRIAVVLRPCEIRALVELSKLHQCVFDDLVIIGIECRGRMENDDFLGVAEEVYTLEETITQTCKTCDEFLPVGADITLSVIGMPEGTIGMSSENEKGEALLSGLDISKGALPAERDKVISDLLENRVAAKEALFNDISEKIKPIEKFQELIGSCLNCYNCRTACPVCYCKECVFLTDIFAHKPEVLFQKAEKKGALKLPTDTSMFHMTRLAHMSHACVGCGHCSSVCPSNIPVADFFRAVSASVQELYKYKAGSDVSENIPYLAYIDESS